MVTYIVNLLLSITQFPFSLVSLLDNIAHIPSLDLKKALDNCIANADTMVKKITSIMRVVQRKNKSEKYESPQLKIISTAKESDGSSQTIQIRVSKTTRENLRRASLIS